MPLSDDDIESMSDEELQDEISYRQALTSGEEPNSGTQKGKPDAFDVAFDELERLNHEVMLRALNAPGASITETPTPRRPKPKKKPSGQASKQKTSPSTAQTKAAPGADVEVAPDPSTIDATFLPEMLWRQKVLQPHPDLHRLIQSPLPLSDAVSRICSAAITECEAIATMNAGTVSLRPLHLWFGFLALGRLEHQHNQCYLPGSLYRAWKFDESTYMRARRQVMEQTRIHKEGKPGTVARHALTTIIRNKSFELHQEYSPKDRYLAARHLLAALLLHAAADPELKRFLEYLGLSLKAAWAQLEVNIELNKHRDRAGAWEAVLSHAPLRDKFSADGNEQDLTKQIESGPQLVERENVLSILRHNWVRLIKPQLGTPWSGTMQSVLTIIQDTHINHIRKLLSGTRSSDHLSDLSIPYGLSPASLVFGLMLYGKASQSDFGADESDLFSFLANSVKFSATEIQTQLEKSFLAPSLSSTDYHSFHLVSPCIEKITDQAAAFVNPASADCLKYPMRGSPQISARHLVAAILLDAHQRGWRFDSDNNKERPLIEGGPHTYHGIFLDALERSLPAFAKTDNQDAWNTLLARIGTTLEGSGLNSSRVCTDEELGQDVTLTAQAVAEVFRSAHSESSGSDFILALYGPWGRGKTTLMEKVVENLTSKSTEPSAIKEKTFARDNGYRALTFSAWKYPTRPEVWVHLYERIREAASSQDWCQRLRLSFRLGLLDAGWTPLISGLSLMLLAAILTRHTNGTSWGLFTGVSGALLSSTFFLRTTAFGKMVAQRYLKAPDHTDKLGLQAVIGRDLTHLLQAWITPPRRAPDKPTQEQHEENTKLSCIDFRIGRRGDWRAATSLVLVFSIITALLCGARSHYSKQLSTYDSPANQDLIQAAKAPLETHLFSASLGSTIVSGTWAKLREPAPEPESPWPLTIICTLAGLLASAYLWLVTRPLQRQEKLLLIVDDLDRCEPHQMLAVIDSLRLFLDDRAMSGRLQIAMLMDRELLETALKVRVTKSKMFNGDKAGWENYFQSQREKLFVCELEMPALSETNRDEIVDKLLPLPVNDPQPDRDDTEAPATAAGASSASTSGMPAQPAGAFGHPPEKAPAEAPSVEEQSSPPLQHSLGEESPAPPPAQDIRTPATSTPKITAREIKALQEAIKKVPAHLLTPRSIRMIKVRFELARLLLKTFGIPATSTQLAHLIISRFVPGSQPTTRANSDVERIVSYVTCDSRPKDKKAS